MLNFFYRQYSRFYWLACYRELKLTKFGSFLRLAILLSLIFGLNTESSMNYQLFAFLTTAYLVAFLLSLVKNKNRFEIKRSIPQYGSVGQELNLKLTIKNLSNQDEKEIFIREAGFAPKPSRKEFAESREPFEHKRNRWDRFVKYHRWIWLIKQNSRFKAKESKIELIHRKSTLKTSFKITPLKRGLLNLEGIYLLTKEPFGFLRTINFYETSGKIIVLPKLYKIPQFKLSGKRKFQPGGVTLANSVGNSDEFVSLRDYQPGDPLNKIHWKSFAKIQKPIVKEFIDEYFTRFALVLDTNITNRNQENIFEKAVSVAASFLNGCDLQEAILDLIFIGDKPYHFTAGRGLGDTGKILEVLAAVRHTKNPIIPKLKQALFSYLNQLSSLVLILSSWDSKRSEFITFLKNYGLKISVILLYSEESEIQNDKELENESIFKINIHNIEKELLNFNITGK